MRQRGTIRTTADSRQNYRVIQNKSPTHQKRKNLSSHSKKKPQDIPHLIMEGEEIERVTETKLLGVIISNNLKWDAHVKYVVAKASKRLFYLRQLKYAGLHENELVRVYKALVRPICEYACPVWSTHLPKQRFNNIESFQKRAMKIIKPSCPYEAALKDQQLELKTGKSL
jgi:hypothetical protein